MTPENFDNSLRVFVERKPFQVFPVEFHGGHRFEIDGPNTLVFRDGVAVFVAPGGIPIIFDHESVNMLIGAEAKSLQ
ncbi:MAG: hypothetical protein L0241_19080 [Planctomycetia bacterium]|nr:hypothetical protein [Planctomycetia bacterium]